MVKVQSCLWRQSGRRTDLDNQIIEDPKAKKASKEEAKKKSYHTTIVLTYSRISQMRQTQGWRVAMKIAVDLWSLWCLEIQPQRILTRGRRRSAKELEPWSCSWVIVGVAWQKYLWCFSIICLEIAVAVQDSCQYRWGWHVKELICHVWGVRSQEKKRRLTNSILIIQLLMLSHLPCPAEKKIALSMPGLLHQDGTPLYREEIMI